jgi:hypothetical protein
MLYRKNGSPITIYELFAVYDVDIAAEQRPVNEKIDLYCEGYNKIYAPINLN